MRMLRIEHRSEHFSISINCNCIGSHNTLSPRYFVENLTDIRSSVCTVRYNVINNCHNNFAYRFQRVRCDWLTWVYRPKHKSWQKVSQTFTRTFDALIVDRRYNSIRTFSTLKIQFAERKWNDNAFAFSVPMPNVMFLLLPERKEAKEKPIDICMRAEAATDKV